MDKEKIDDLLIYIRIINKDDIILCTILNSEKLIYDFCENWNISINTYNFTTPLDLEIAFFNKHNLNNISLCNHLIIDTDPKRIKNNVLFFLLSYIKNII